MLEDNQTIRDNRGRIKWISPSVVIPHGKSIKGHSVCNKCGKDMPICWNVVCSKCNKTFCYQHAKAGMKFWYCLDCWNKKWSLIV